jgi:hypothetical protein
LDISVTDRATLAFTNSEALIGDEMATAAKLAIDLDALSAAEEYALLTGEEIFAASRETSRQYNGVVLAKAVVIVQTRLRCSSLAELGRRLHLSRSMMARHAKALPTSDHHFHRSMSDLAILLEEERTR